VPGAVAVCRFEPDCSTDGGSAASGTPARNDERRPAHIPGQPEVFIISSWERTRREGSRRVRPSLASGTAGESG
jgi:hypothetical protein